MDIDAGQLSAMGGQTLHAVAGLSPAAQVATVIMLGLMGLAWLGKPYIPLMRRGVDEETTKQVVNALTEYTVTMSHMVERSEKAVEGVQEAAQHVAAVASTVSKVVELNLLLVAQVPGIPHDAIRQMMAELSDGQSKLKAQLSRAA